MRSLDNIGAPGAGWNPLADAAPPRAGGAFGALYGQLQGEVRAFIEQGSAASALPAQAPGLSPEGQWRALPQQQPQPPVDGEQQRAFVDAMTPLAQGPAERLGVAPEVLVAQAALESGWGRQPVRRADGSDAHNLFGIKAGAAWSGETAEARTTEFEAGQARAERANFRSYEGPAQSFQDLAQLLGSSPRYHAALGAGSDAQAYGQALQRGGYATDPAYADKLARVAARLQGAKP